MNIPKYWARATAVASGLASGDIQVFKWHWSDTSQEDAQNLAKQRAEDLAQRLAAGEPFPGHYAYGTSRPLREEILRELPGDGDAPSGIITRVVYGAQVLNAARVMFVDIDLPKEKPKSGGLLGRLFGKSSPPAPEDSPEKAALSRIENWLNQNIGWGFRIYRTAAGLRLIATQDLFEPDADATLRVMEALGSDPLYVKLCRAQKCFRARLTPKPWRIRLGAMMLRYPYEVNQVAHVRQWVAEYDRKSSDWATCEFVKTAGTTNIAPGAEAIIGIHDEMTRATVAGLKLA